MPDLLKEIPIVGIPLRAYNIMGLQNIRSFLAEDQEAIKSEQVNSAHIPQLKDVIDDIYSTHKKVIFTMSKGGVGKTTVAAAVALGLAKKGVKVHLTTTDPAAHLNNVINEQTNISMSQIDEHEVLQKYKQTVLSAARENNLSDDDIAYIEEDLRSPCTQEIAVFRAFADIVGREKKRLWSLTLPRPGTPSFCWIPRRATIKRFNGQWAIRQSQ